MSAPRELPPRRQEARAKALALIAEIGRLQNLAVQALMDGGLNYPKDAHLQCNYCGHVGGGACESCSLYNDGSAPPQGVSCWSWWHIDRSEPGGCWPWIGTLRNGYASASGYGDNFGETLGHRMMYRAAHPGEDISGLVVHHSCRVKHCVNPDHLEAITASEHGTRHYREANP